jgi:proteasome lid subunit RPN8/RPN11
MTAKGSKVKSKAQPVVVMEAEVARKIRQHARTSMKAEVCGVLIGGVDQERTLIEACIPGVNAAQGGAHVTFTQDTWEHIYKIKDQQFPDGKIVGWYHSHPGFGVFLSEHDLFIQENFFSSPHQVAWVYDPHTDEEGCFGWVGGKTEKLSGLRFGYSQSVDSTISAAVDDNDYSGEDLEPARHGGFGFQDDAKEARRDPAWLRWTSQIMSYVAVSGMGFVLGVLLLMWRWGPAHELGQMVMSQPQRTCERILELIPPPQGDVSAPRPQPGEKPPANPQPGNAMPEKGSHGNK